MDNTLSNAYYNNDDAKKEKENLYVQHPSICLECFLTFLVDVFSRSKLTVKLLNLFNLRK